MKGGLKSRFEVLIQRRFQQRDRGFVARLLAVKQEHNRRGILMSSITVAAMHRELEGEFEESATACVKTLAELMENRPTALLVPGKGKVVRLCSNALLARKIALDVAFQGASANIEASLIGSMTAPHRSLSDSFVELQIENACEELRTRQRKLFWSKLKRMKLGVALVVALVAAISYLGRAEIAALWKSFGGEIEKPAHEAGEGSRKAVTEETEDA